MDKTRISIEEFLSIAGVKIDTVKRNKDKIPGLTYENGKFDIVKGTRYPYSRGNNRLKTSADRRYHLLLATSQYKYIDHEILKVYQEQFEEMIEELLEAGLIKPNHLYNEYGANAYDCTPKGDEILKLGKREAVEYITELIAKGAGHFVGAVLSEQ